MSMKTCPSCGQSWVPRSENPVKCPRCWTHLDPPKATTTITQTTTTSLGEEIKRATSKAPTACSRCGMLNGLHQKGCKGK